jgi:hypothetical protein
MGNDRDGAVATVGSVALRLDLRGELLMELLLTEDFKEPGPVKPELPKRDP